jgi:anaerobic ribonucleoside-triphosphate reductase activating protein
MLPFSGGREASITEIVTEIDEAKRLGIEGITLLGGEPIAHADAAASLARAVRSRGLSVMVFSGYTLEEIQARPEPASHDLLAFTDILVDGPYRADLPDTRRRWIGSTNQRIHFLTSRYAADDACWQKRNTLEIRLRGGELAVNGFPGKSAVSLWRKLHLTAESPRNVLQ